MEKKRTVPTVAEAIRGARSSDASIFCVTSSEIDRPEPQRFGQGG